MKQQLDASQTARDVEVLLIEAGWIQAADKRNGEPAPFLQGSPKLFVINAIHGGTEYAIGGGEDQAHRTPMDAARYLIGMIQPKEAEPVEAVAPVTYTPAAEPAPAPDTEAVNLAAENERLRARIAELESASYIDRDERPDAVEESPIPPPPSPAVVALDAMEALKARMDAARVHPEVAALLTEGETAPDAIERLTPDEDALLNLGASLSEEALEEALRAIPRSAREKWMEGLHGTHADLRLKRGTDKENLQREAQVTRMMTLLGRVGEKR